MSHPIAPPPEEEEPGDGRPIVVSIALEKAELRQGTTRIVLSTPKPLEVNTDGNLAGEIAVVDGNLNLLGKVFEFDRGVVRLRPEEPDNPYVNVTARWRSSNETVVYIDYVGLVKSLSGKQIRFRSVPPLPQDEILALLLLGGADAGTDQAANLTRGIAAAQFNALLGDIAPGLSTSFATAEGYIGTTFIYQVSDSVTARATVESADTSGVTTSADGAATSGATGNTARTSVSIDWRFAARWLLRGTVGVGQQASSSLDVLYQFRY
jgi:translocation and assembly module TamB